MKKKIFLITLISLLFNCEAIFIENISEETVVLLAPSNNSEVSTGIIAFNWQEITDATTYQIQIAQPNFANASQIVLDSTAASTIISKNLDIGDYEWRVKALNSSYNTNYTTHSFTVK